MSNIGAFIVVDCVEIGINTTLKSNFGLKIALNREVTMQCWLLCPNCLFICLSITLSISPHIMKYSLIWANYTYTWIRSDTQDTQTETEAACLCSSCHKYRPMNVKFSNTSFLIMGLRNFLLKKSTVKLDLFLNYGTNT